jgi:hypothetical protein
MTAGGAGGAARLMDELGEAAQGGARVPDFFLVGMPKCGTTALYKMLRMHPGLFMPPMKEPHFLSRSPEEERRGRRVPDTLDAYLELFAGAAPSQLTGEGSTSYLFSSVAPERIARINPDARAIAIVREPAAFLRSVHLQLYESGIETEPDLATALALEPQRRAEAADLWERMLLYSDHLRWTEQLRRYHEALGDDRVLTLIYDDVRADNRGTLRRVAGFLGIDDEFEPQRVEANATVYRRDSRVGAAVRRLTTRRARVGKAARRMTRFVPPRMRRKALVGIHRALEVREPPPVDERLMAELRTRFAGEVAAAGDYLGRDLLGLWGYPEAGARPAAR